MTTLFDIVGENLDRGYLNLREPASKVEREMHRRLEAMWAVYEPYADPDFREGFARDPDGRFWEMYIGYTLIEEGRTLLPAAKRQRGGGQPDLCVIDGERRIWIEAIAPDVGTAGPDQVRGPNPINEGGSLVLKPVRQAQLRITSAFWTKSQKVKSYLQQGVIGTEDVRLIAIGAARFGIYAPEEPFPLVMSSLFPVGPEFVTIDREHGNVLDRGFYFSPTIERQGQNPIPRTAFIGDDFDHISGVIWSRVTVGNTSRKKRPLTLVHNPKALVAMPHTWGVWDREFVTSKCGENWQAVDILARDPQDASPSEQAE